MRFIHLILSLSLLFLVYGCDKPSEAEKKVAKAPVEQKLFQTLSPAQTGVDFNNQLPENPQLNILSYQAYYNGAGVSIGDINNDGLSDLFFVGNLVPSRLYLNKGGMKFEEITPKSGIKPKVGWRTGSCMADVNGDGWLDIYIGYSGKTTDKQRENELFINNQDGTFTEKAEEYGLNHPGYATQAAFFDYDKDGDLDMYLLNYQITRFPFLKKPLEQLRAEVSPLAGDKLFRNNGPGKKFTDVTVQAGIKSNYIGYGLGVAVGDLNKDGWPDLYISNDFLEQDYLYINQKNGTFRDEMKDMLGHTPQSSMGNDIADFNNDGWLDIFATDMMPASHYRQKTNMPSMSTATFRRRVKEGFHYQYMFNTLQVNNQNGTYSDVGKIADISKTDWSWAPLFADFDNDGWKDIFVTNGIRKDPTNNDMLIERDQRLQAGQPIQQVVQEMLPRMNSEKLANYMFKNEGKSSGSLRFSKMSGDWGLADKSFSNGAAYGDLDNDGDLDLVVNNIDGPAFIHENKAESVMKDNHFLRIRLEGESPNTFGVGTKVELRNKGKILVQEMYPSRGYQSSVDYIMHFGLGEMALIENLTVTWPDDRTQQMKNVKADQELILRIKDAGKEKPGQEPAPEPLFTNTTRQSGISFRHRENDFDDFEREVLLPHKMSTLGPALSSGDANGDGLDDIFIGGAKGQAGVFYLQENNGKFTQKAGPWTADKNSEDIASTFFDADGDGDLDLYVVSGGNEVAASDAAMQDRLYLNNGGSPGKGNFTKAKNVLPSMPSSGGCVAAQDFDGDGDLDLFVGGRQTPGKYPFPSRSYLLRNDNGKFTDVTEEIARPLREVGMVSSAVWGDLNGDKKPDLVLAGEWMPVSIFLQENGEFIDNTQQAGLIHSVGWWYSLAVCDMDMDGDMDIIGGNLGLNYKYKAKPEKPFRIYSGDFDKNGTNDIVLAFNEGANTYPLRGRECSSQQIPEITQKFPTYDAFGTATLMDVYGIENLNQSLQYQAKTFASTYFENKGDGTFKAHLLPDEAQISSVNGIIPNDWDGDGILDLVIAGNLFDSEVETPRSDAGMGLVLIGDGKGNFNPIPVRESGFYAPGNVKAMTSVETKSGKVIIIGRSDGEVSVLKRAGSGI